jgi:hypothetical protein
MDLFPILEGREPEVERTLFWRTSVGNRVQKAVRLGEWKLVIDGTHTFVFNLGTDISERHDLANRRQDIARQLQLRLTAWERDIDEEARRNQTVTPAER